MDKNYYGLLLFLILLSSVIKFAVPHDRLISQISPKSQDFDNDDLESLETSMNTEILNEKTVEHKANEATRNRVERSASPIINEVSSSIVFEKHPEYEDNNVVQLNAAGRYINFDINPTRTQLNGFNNIKTDLNGLTTDFSNRRRKNLDENSFLVKRGPRLESASGPLLSTSKPNNSIVMRTGSNVNEPRQNPNPDIQDIITGIVKLLNGNVNVHANTQTSRRPSPSRINNRGPPRISESQPLPLDYEFPPPTNRPPPYPFERPEGPIRPFLTGVPIPEQIVPSMQQNYRPGFISQNRPPWQRPRPRPPFGNPRPPLPYKPLPPQPDYRPQEEEEEVQITTDVEPTPNQPFNDDITTTTSTTTEENLDFHHNHESHNYYVEEIVEDANGDNDEDESTKEKEDDINKPNSTSDTYTNNNNNNNKKKEEYMKKKEKLPVKISEKKQINQPTAAAPNEIEPSEIEKEVQQTTIETVPEVKDQSETSTMLESSIVETADVVKPTVETPNLPILVTTVEQTTTTPLITNLIEVTEVITTTTTSTTTKTTYTNDQSTVNPQYHPRPGIVLDDPEFKPGSHQRPQPPRIAAPQIKPTRPPGYGEIFDVTLSAIQGPGSGGGGNKQVINIKPYGYPSGNGGQSDIIVSPNGDDGFVSIDGKRTYINLFGEQTDAPVPPENIQPTAAFTNNQNSQQTQLIPPGVTGTGYAVAETEPPPQQPAKSNRPNHYRPQHQPQQPPIRIDTCIVGDDSTCDQAQNEKCKTDNGVSSCHCRPGYSRRKHREPCRKIVSIIMSLRVDKIYDRRIVWDNQLSNTASEPYTQLSYESIRAIESAMSMTPFSDEYMKAKVNKIYQGEATQGSGGVFVNLTLMLEENLETLRPSLKNDVQRHLLGVIHRRNNNIGNSALFVDSPPGAISRLQDLDECTSNDLNDCHSDAVCSNVWGSFRCECQSGFKDPWQDQPTRSGRDCQSCPESYCNNRGTCSYEANGSQACICVGSYYGSQCEIDGEVLGVAIGASVAAVIIIILTLICLVMWSRRWHREQKNAIGSPVFGYMTAPMKTGSLNQGPYQVTLEDRMRWAQIADVMAQANHYAAEPINPSRPSSTMFGYPTLQAIGNMNALANMSNLGSISMAGTLPMHNGTLPPVPLPRLNIHSRSNGMRTLENSSSSEEEDRTDLLGRNFHVPRPKSRSNGSIANQSGIYYDVDYEPSGGGVNDNMYGVTMQTNTVPGPQGIPMSTYTAGKAPSSYYMK